MGSTKRRKPMTNNRIMSAIKRGVLRYVAFVQKILMNTLLFFVYYVVLGITKMIIVIFQPSLINFYKVEKPFWKKPIERKLNEKYYNSPF